MSSTNASSGRSDPIVVHARPLPSAPSLEYERKEAKALLERIHVGEGLASPTGRQRRRATLIRGTAQPGTTKGRAGTS